MGTCSRAVLSYGFILDEEHIIKLLKALECDEDELSDAIEDGEFVETINNWLEGQKETEPYYFQALKGDREDDKEEGAKLAIIFSDESQLLDLLKTEPVVEVWGRD
ncbi:hypothetical protein C0993_004904, partial [Termitomyces sp. T159_Od127]